MALTLQEARGFLKISKHALDEELIRHSQLLGDIGEASVLANARMDRAKENLSATDAEVSIRIRMDFEDSKVKYTEGKLSQQVQVDSEHEEAFDEYMDAKQEANEWSTLKESFVTRGYMLRDLCSLYNAEYFTINSVPGKNYGEDGYEKDRKKMKKQRKKKRETLK